MKEPKDTQQQFKEIYAPPKAQLEKSASNRYYVSGDLLVAQSPLILPRRCVKTGQKDSQDKTIAMLTRDFTDTSLSGIRFRRKRYNITYGLNPQLRDQLNQRILIGRIVAYLGILAVPLSILLSIEGNFLISLTGLLVALVATTTISENLPLRVIKCEGTQFYIKGCSREFLDAISEK